MIKFHLLLLVGHQYQPEPESRPVASRHTAVSRHNVNFDTSRGQYWKQQQEDFACHDSHSTSYRHHDVPQALLNAADRTHSNSSSSSTGSRQSFQPSKCRYILIPFLIHNTLRLCISSNMQLIDFIEKLYF